MCTSLLLYMESLKYIRIGSRLKGLYPCHIFLNSLLIPQAKTASQEEWVKSCSPYFFKNVQMMHVVKVFLSRKIRLTVKLKR